MFGCLGLDTCYNCVYDLDYRILDDCGNEIIKFTKTIGSLSEENCEFSFNLKENDADIEAIPNYTIVQDSIVLDLDVGEYQVIKYLTVNTDSLMSVFNERVELDSCLKTAEDFYEELYAKIDFSKCDTCLTCEEENDICGSKEEPHVDGCNA